VSVFGPFGSQVLVQMSAAEAEELFPGCLAVAGPTDASEAVGRDLEKIAKADPALADSGLAATAKVLARELDHPFNSATSKSMCAKALADALGQLRDLTPVQVEGDKLDALTDSRAERLGGGAAAAN